MYTLYIMCNNVIYSHMKLTYTRSIDFDGILKTLGGAQIYFKQNKSTEGECIIFELNS